MRLVAITQEKCSLKVLFSILLVISGLAFSFQIPRGFAQPDFSIMATPSTLGPLSAASTATSTISIVSNGFSGSVNIMTNNTALSSLNTTSVNLSPASTAYASLTVIPSDPGLYSINVTVSAGSISRSQIIQVEVTGEICLADPSYVAGLARGSDPCPTTPYTFNGPTAASHAPEQIRVGVYIWKSKPFNAFGISLLADHTILTPSGADLTGSVLPGSPLIAGECIGGVAESVGQPCSPTDNPDTLDFAAAGFPGLSRNPTSGLLFTAIYNITGSSGPSGISLGFQMGCTPSSVSGSGNLCVVVANGSLLLVNEVVQGGRFLNNSSPPPPQQDFTLSTSKSSLGPISPSATDRSITLTVTVVNGFSGTVSLSASVSPSGGLAASLSPASIMGAGSSTLVLTPSAPGTYSVNITATSGTIVHFKVVTVSVSSPSPLGTSPFLSPAIVYSIIALAVIVGLVTVFLVIRLRRSRV